MLIRLEGTLFYRLWIDEETFLEAFLRRDESNAMTARGRRLLHFNALGPHENNKIGNMFAGIV